MFEFEDPDNWRLPKPFSQEPERTLEDYLQEYYLICWGRDIVQTYDAAPEYVQQYTYMVQQQTLYLQYFREHHPETNPDNWVEFTAEKRKLLKYAQQDKRKSVSRKSSTADDLSHLGAAGPATASESQDTPTSSTRERRRSFNRDEFLHKKIRSLRCNTIVKGRSPQVLKETIEQSLKKRREFKFLLSHTGEPDIKLPRGFDLEQPLTEEDCDYIFRKYQKFTLKTLGESTKDSEFETFKQYLTNFIVAEKIKRVPEENPDITLEEEFVSADTTLINQDPQEGQINPSDLVKEIERQELQQLIDSGRFSLFKEHYYTVTDQDSNPVSSVGSETDGADLTLDGDEQFEDVNEEDDSAFQEETVRRASPILVPTPPRVPTPPPLPPSPVPFVFTSSTMGTPTAAQISSAANYQTLLAQAQYHETAIAGPPPAGFTRVQVENHITDLRALQLQYFTVSRDIYTAYGTAIGTRDQDLKDVLKIIMDTLHAAQIIQAGLPPVPGAAAAAAAAPAATPIIIFDKDEFTHYFDGKPQSWAPFEDKWNHYWSKPSKATAQDNEKLQLLQARVNKDTRAFQMVNKWSVTDANYLLALAELKKNFNMQKDRLRDVCTSLLNLPAVTQGRKPEEIATVVQTISQAKEILTQIDPDKDHHIDYLLHFIALQKLDFKTNEDWEMSQKHKNDLAPWTEFEEFVLARARALATTQGEQSCKKTDQKKDQRTTAKSAHHATTASNVTCLKHNSKSHSIFECVEFQNMSPRDRASFIKESNGCFKCLMPRHPAQEKCPKDNLKCRNCQRTHHQMICYANSSNSNNSNQNNQNIQNSSQRNISQSQSGNQNQRFIGNNNNSRNQRPRNNNRPQSENSSNNNQSNNVNNTAESTQANSSPQSQPTQSQNQVAMTHHSLSSSGQNSRRYIFLATALADAEDRFGNKKTVRMFLDKGSDTSFISRGCLSLLQLPTVNVDWGMKGVNNQDLGRISKAANLILHSKTQNYKIRIFAGVVQRPADDMPKEYIPTPTPRWNYIQDNHVKLADPLFNEPGVIDILLGCEHVPQIERDGRILGPPGLPYLQNTTFGYIVNGPCDINTSRQRRTVQVNHCALDNQLKRYFEAEDVIVEKQLSKEEQLAVEHFNDTSIRQENGQVIVSLPFKPDHKPLGNSRNQAQRRLDNLFNKLDKKPELKEEYTKVIQEYLDLGHARIIENPEQDSDQTSYYLPHHPVIREEAVTTKLRVVFDASAKTTNGNSLNDCLLIGPKCQPDLINQLIKFRSYQIAITGDITKMYRMFRMKDEDQKFQRILWRNKENNLITVQLETDTFGVSAAPHLAIMGTQKIAKEEMEDCPLGSKALINNLYVDDLSAGAKTAEEIIELYNQVNEVCHRGGLKMAKWTCSSSIVREQLQLNNENVDLMKNENQKTLGLGWNPIQDIHYFKVVAFEEEKKLTKRVLLSNISRLFDPIGYLSPITIVGKIFMQETWKLKITWDQELPTDIKAKWNKYKNELKEIENIKIPRAVVHLEAKYYELHAFGDASEKAYAACIYLKVMCENEMVHTHLIAGKTRVSGSETLPRLELKASVLAAKLLQVVKDSLEVKIKDCLGWTDAMIVYAWLQSEPARWKTYVANRVAIIQKIIPSNKWNHIPGPYNPADCASRGITPLELLNHELWWKGPPQLLQSEYLKPRINEYALPEEKVLQVQHQVKENLMTKWIEDFSSYNKLIRTTALILRFKNNCLKTELINKNKYLTQEEVDRARLVILKQVQQECFPEEIKNLKEDKQVDKDSQLKYFNPIMDNGLLKVGGRLLHAEILHGQKYPIVLPTKHHLTTLLILHYHLKDCHSNSKTLLSTLRQNYWIIRGPAAVFNFIKKCIICQRFRPQEASQMMANLPSSRVNPYRCFSHVGVDMAGPVYVLDRKGRGQKTTKCYIAVFVCFSTKAVHLELVDQMDTPSFINALHRFSSIRGLPDVIYSDNGKNFVGANNEIKKWYEEFQNSDVNKALQDTKIQWKFIPVASPHFGGLWEAAVKSMKHHLYRVIQDHHLTREEITTLLARISAILNSRPLTTPSNDPSDPVPLTPGHFIIGQSMTQLPEPDVSELKDNTLSRWQRVSALYQKIWNRWSKEYLHELQKRSKWIKEQPNLQVGQLVLIKDENLPPMKWEMARITKLLPGVDGKVRAVTLKVAECKNKTKNLKELITETKEFDIVIAKVAPLNVDSIYTSHTQNA